MSSTRGASVCVLNTPTGLPDESATPRESCRRLPAAPRGRCLRRRPDALILGHPVEIVLNHPVRRSVSQLLQLNRAARSTIRAWIEARVGLPRVLGRCVQRRPPKVEVTCWRGHAPTSFSCAVYALPPTARELGADRLDYLPGGQAASMMMPFGFLKIEELTSNETLHG